MPAYIKLKVEAVRPGYPHQIRLQYPEPFWSAELENGRLVAHFRSSVPGPLLFEADTQDGTIFRAAPRTVVIDLPATATLAMAPADVVVFDFANLSGPAKRAVPGRYIWPVRRTVTRDV